MEKELLRRKAKEEVDGCSGGGAGGEGGKVDKRSNCFGNPGRRRRRRSNKIL